MTKVITGAEVVIEAEQWLGIPYKFGAEVRPEGMPEEWDCSEFVQFVLERLGIENVPDGSWNQFAWCGQYGLHKTVDQVRGVAGALVFRRNPDNQRICHIGFTDGRNNTIEARSRKLGTGKWPWRESWTEGSFIPGIAYPVTAR